MHNSGNKDDPSNYRVICISSCLGKVFCSILNTRLLNFSNNHKILHRYQIGFLPGHRASEHIFSLRTLIDQHVTHCPRGKLYTCFVDFKKAFDSIWHQGLLYKLLKYNIGGSFYKIISSMYSNSICCVKDNYTRSEFFNYDKGVRQGCILSPLLFNLYLNELPFILNNNATRWFSLKLNCLLYADDLPLISNSAEGLQQSLDRLSKCCQDWLLKINPAKTKVIVFQKKSRKSAIDKGQHYVTEGT